MSKFKPYMISNMMSFASLVLVFVFLSYMDQVPFDENTVLLLFAMTSCISVVMFLTDKIRTKQKEDRIVIIDLLEIAGVVLGIGIPVGLIPVEWPVLLLVAAIILGVYFITILMVMIKTKTDEKHINDVLSNMRRKKRGVKNA